MARKKSVKNKAKSPLGRRARGSTKKRVSPKTIDLIRKLHLLIKRNKEKWDRRYPGVILGCHVAKKVKKKKVKRHYAVVFHVDRKIPESQLKPKECLPKYLYVSTKSGKRKVPTDIIEAGIGNIRMASEIDPALPGDKVSDTASESFGTIGPVVTKEDDLYIVSNMHVLGKGFLRNGRREVQIPKENQTPDIEKRNGNERTRFACFARGILDESLDAAIARILDPAAISAVVPGFGIPKGYKDLNESEVRPDGYSASIVGAVSGKVAGKVVETAVLKDFDYGDPIGKITLYNLLRTGRLITQGGDSGSVLIDSQRNVIGIIVGDDRIYSYAIPISTILLTYEVSLYTI